MAAAPPAAAAVPPPAAAAAPPAAVAAAPADALAPVLQRMRIQGRDADSARELLNLSLQAAEGFTAPMAIEIVRILFTARVIPYKLIIGLLGTVGQIKQNVERNDIMREIEEVLELSTSDSSRRAVINFSAARICGELIAALLGQDILTIKKLSDKHGNIWIGGNFPDNEGGKISKALRESLGNPALPAIEVPAAVLQNLRDFYAAAGNGVNTSSIERVRTKVAQRYT